TIAIAIAIAIKPKAIDLTFNLAVTIILLWSAVIYIDLNRDGTRTALKRSTIDTWSRDPPRT
ncbi:hypothetical protein OC834_004702, partial [Tilletia horrida]